jgi:2-phosphosulfolactate phosphatase
MPKVHVCLSPDLFSLYADRESIVVVTDVFRATTTMCLALDGNVNSIFPVATVAEALECKPKDETIYAAERNGKIVNGFQYGNSPKPFLGKEKIAENMVISTTNGTRMISLAKKDHEVVVGAFVNISAVEEYLVKQNKSVIICCSGWKGKFCLEDTLFAGALAKRLKNHNQFDHNCDSLRASEQLYTLAEEDVFQYLKQSSHRNRLKALDIEEDIHICLKEDISTVVPILKGNTLTKANI